MTSRFDNIVVAMGEQMPQSDKIINLVTEDIGKHRREKEEKEKIELAKLLEKRVELTYDIKDEYEFIYFTFIYYIGIIKVVSFSFICFQSEAPKLDLFIHNIENKKEASLSLEADHSEEYDIESLGLNCDEIKFTLENYGIEIIIPTHLCLKHFITIRNLFKPAQQIDEQNE